MMKAESKISAVCEVIIEMNIQIGYLGPMGTFSEEAARRVGTLLEKGARSVGSSVSPKPGEPVQYSVHYSPYKGIAALISAVDAGEIDYAVVPAENSYEGSVSPTWDILFHYSSAEIIREVLVSVRHHLLVQRGTKLSSVGTVLSHPQALAQCRRFLSEHLPNAKQFETASTAEAARVVSVNSLPLAAIGTEQCASIYGLDIVARDIQDLQNNVTRFLVLSKGDNERKSLLVEAGLPYKTSIVCAIERDRPGSLYELLGVFAAKQINLTRIESRPSRQGYGDYVFFIDVEGTVTDAALKESLDRLSEKVISLKVLGSYQY